MLRDPRFHDAAICEIAQGRFAKNEAIGWSELPEFLMSDAEWAWNAGYAAGKADRGLSREEIARDVASPVHELR